MSQKVITFSIAAYNVEKTLPKLIESLAISEIIDEIEILVINDGSTDNTALVARKYQMKYPKTIKIINKKNAGHGSTINKGIELANGKYFRSIDGDDWVDKEGTVKTVEKLRNENADVVVNDYIDFMELTGEEKLKSFNSLARNKIMLINEFLSMVSWIRYHALTYKTSLLRDNSIKLSENVFYDDIQYIMYPLSFAKTVVYYNIPLYCYRIGRMGQSVSMQGRKKHLADAFYIGKRITEFAENKEIAENGQDEISHFVLTGIINHWIWYILSLESFNVKDYWRSVNFNELKKYLKMYPYIDNSLAKKMRLYRIMTTNKVIDYPLFAFYKMKQYKK